MHASPRAGGAVRGCKSGQLIAAPLEATSSAPWFLVLSASSLNIKGRREERGVPLGEDFFVQDATAGEVLREHSTGSCPDRKLLVQAETCVLGRVGRGISFRRL